MLTAALVLAQSYVVVPFPQWDVDGACGRFPPYAAKACVEKEQASYEALKDEWERMADAERERVKAAGDKATSYRYTTANLIAENLLAIDEARRPVQVPRFQQ